MSGRSKFFLVLTIFFLSLLLRLVHLYELEVSVLKNHISGDEITHKEWAESILKDSPEYFAPFFRGPLYGFFLAFISVFSNDMYLIRLMQACLGSFTVLFTVFLGLELFSPFIAFFAGIFISAYPLLMYFEGQLLMTTLYTFLLSGGLFFTVKMIKTGRNGIMAGLFWGLASITRPNILPFVGIVIIFLIKKKQWKDCFSCGSVFLLVLALTAFYNLHFGSEYCLVSTQGGINFYAGNNKTADGIIPLAPSYPLKLNDLIQKKVNQKVWKRDNMWQASLVIPFLRDQKIRSETASSKWWFRETFKEIKEEPWGFVSRICKKMFFFAGDLEPPNNTDPVYGINGFFPLLKILFYSGLNFGVLWCLFFPGLFVGYQKYRKQVLFLSIYLGINILVLLFFFVNSRFRVPFVPVMALFAGITLENFWKNKHLRRQIVFYLVFAFIFSQGYRVYAISWQLNASRALYFNSLAEAFYKAGDSENAMKEVDHALKLKTNEQFIFAFTKAKIYRDLLKDFEKAKNWMEESLRLQEHPSTYFQLGEIYQKTAQYEKAIVCFEKFLYYYPNHESAKESIKSILKDNE